MLQLNSPMFFFQWQLLYAATNPLHTADRWMVDDVEWIKEQHSHSNDQYAAHHFIHRLTRYKDKEIDWQLIVVVEEWWGPNKKKSLRSTKWCKALQGDPKKITTWMKKLDAKRNATIEGNL